MVMVADVRVSLLGRRTGARLEVRRARVQGRVEASGGPVATARVEMGFRSGGEVVASKTFTARVGEEFSQWLELPGEGPCRFCIGVVELKHVVYSNDVGVRPMEGRDLRRGSRLAVTALRLDPRGRILESRLAVYQGAISSATPSPREGGPGCTIFLGATTPCARPPWMGPPRSTICGSPLSPPSMWWS